MPAPDLVRMKHRIEELAEKDLFFLVGFPRSGTTWLQRILNGHPEICCLGESHFADILFPALQRSLRDYNRRIVQQGGAVAHLSRFGGHVPTLQFETRDMQLLLVYGVYLIFNKWVDSPAIRIIGEKTPDYIRLLPLLAGILPRARFVHVVRDGRDCAVSGWFFNQSNIDRNKSIQQKFEIYVSEFIRQWKAAIALARAASAGLDSRYHEVFYESMVQRPETVVTGILEFLGASSEPSVVRRAVDDARFEALTGGRRPGDENQSSFYRKGVSGDWRNHVDDSLNDHLWKLCGDTLSSMGYART